MTNKFALKPKTYILTSAGFKEEGKEYAYSFSTPEAAWGAYSEEFGKFVIEHYHKYFQGKSTAKITRIEWIRQPEVVSYKVKKFNSGNGTLTKKVFNIYSRFKIENVR